MPGAKPVAFVTHTVLSIVACIGVPQIGHEGHVEEDSAIGAAHLRCTHGEAKPVATAIPGPPRSNDGSMERGQRSI